MKRCLHVLLALTAFVLIVTSWTGASWAQAKIPRVGIILPTAPDQRDLNKVAPGGMHAGQCHPSQGRDRRKTAGVFQKFPTRGGWQN